MKTLHFGSLVLASLVLMLAASCKKQIITPDPDLMKSSQPSAGAVARIGESISGGDNTLPVCTTIMNEFSGAKGWRITWQGGSWDNEIAKNIQSIFSTKTGAVNSINFLNSTPAINTDNADMDIFFTKLKATSDILSLTHVGSLKQTKFKLSNWTVIDLQNAAVNNPNLFGFAYEFGFFGAAVTTTANYAAGQIYLFKTDRVPAKYGAVRIVQTGGATKIIEVVVQK